MYDKTKQTSLLSSNDRIVRAERLSPELLRIKLHLEAKVADLRVRGLLSPGVRFPKGTMKLL